MTRTEPGRERLRHILITRRLELSPGFASRRVFAEDPGTLISYSVVRDLETGTRDNFDEATLLRADMSYKFETGSIGRFLEGGEEPVPVNDDSPDEDMLKRLLRLWRGMTDDQKHLLMTVAEATAEPVPQARYGTG